NDHSSNESPFALRPVGKQALMAERILLFPISLALLALTVAPFLLIEFCHNDDWTLFVPLYRAGTWIDGVAFGRPLRGFFLHLLVLPFVHGVPDLFPVRLISLSILALNLTLCIALLRRYGLPIVVAVCASALIFTLPGAQQRIYHVLALPAVIGNLLAFAA